MLMHAGQASRWAQALSIFGGEDWRLWNALTNGWEVIGLVWLAPEVVRENLGTVTAKPLAWARERGLLT